MLGRTIKIVICYKHFSTFLLFSLYFVTEVGMLERYVSIVTRLRAGQQRNHGLILARVREFSHPISSGAYIASYPVRTDGAFAGVEGSGE
jgi:hypothetical protein